MFPNFMPAIYSYAYIFSYPDFVLRPRNISINFWSKNYPSCFNYRVNHNVKSILMSKTFTPIVKAENLYGAACKLRNIYVLSFQNRHYMSRFFS